LPANCRTEKEYNKNPSAKKIVVEHVMSCHAICRIKKHRIMDDALRNKLRKYDGVSDIVSGLVNTR